MPAQPPAVCQDPYLIAPGTWVIPQLEPMGRGRLAPINSMVIVGAEPVIVDTGCATNRDRWMGQVFSIVEPSDVRWIFLSHADRDHSGNLDAALAACPHATVVSTFPQIGYLMASGPAPLSRMVWVNDGESFDAGDRTLHAVTPPIWDGPGTRGLFDPVTGVYWAVDSFPGHLPHPVTSAAELDRESWADSLFEASRTGVSWHTLVDQAKFDAHLQRSAGLGASVVASAHGAVLSGPMVHEAFKLTSRLPSMGPLSLPGQPVLDQMIAAIAAAPAPALA